MLETKQDRGDSRDLERQRCSLLHHFIGEALAYQPSETPPQLPTVSLALNE